MKILRKIVPLFIITSLISGVLYFQEDIIDYVLKTYIYKIENVVYEANAYHKNVPNNFVEEIDHFVPASRQEILNIVYTLLNYGVKDFKFYCDRAYSKCLDDVSDITDSKDTLSLINNFIHPYNSYNRINVSVNNLGEVKITVTQLYSQVEIDYIEEESNRILSEIITDKMNEREQIKAVHDYIINKTKYDSEFADRLNEHVTNINFTSNKASGLLRDRMAICSGYTDMMAIFLNKLGIPNYKISTEKHVWNYVLVNGTWLHLDLTWNDPVTNTGEDILLTDFFLITTEQLEARDTDNHVFQKEIFEKRAE